MRMPNDKRGERVNHGLKDRKYASFMCADVFQFTYLELFPEPVLERKQHS